MGVWREMISKRKVFAYVRTHTHTHTQSDTHARTHTHTQSDTHTPLSQGVRTRVCVCVFTICVSDSECVITVTASIKMKVFCTAGKQLWPFATKIYFRTSGNFSNKVYSYSYTSSLTYSYTPANMPDLIQKHFGYGQLRPLRPAWKPELGRIIYMPDPTSHVRFSSVLPNKHGSYCTKPTQIQSGWPCYC